MPSPRNTTKMAPEEMLIEALVGGADGFVERIEARGQAELLASTTIPTELRNAPEAFEALGFKLGPVCEGDPLFRECELPDGWQREGSDHAMWSYIVDERGFRRVGIFYKAAPYDRRADTSLVAMPETKAQADAYEQMEAWCPYNDGWSSDKAKDGDNIVWTFKRRERDENGKNVFDHEAGEWKWTGEYRERIVAPDGSIISEREWTE